MPHTPGPWRFVLNAGFSDGQPHASVWIEAGEYRSLASLIPVAEVEANARLIAAAPDLLAVLKAYVTACSEQDIQLGSITGDAVAAIAKAEA